MRPPDTDFASTDSRDDLALLRRYVDARDEAAFTELVRRRVNLVYGAALRQLEGDSHRAEEATQIVFTVLARKAPSVARHPSLAGWLYTTTHYAVSDVLRQERRRRARETEAHMRQEIEGSDAGDDYGRLRPVLDAVLRELNDRDREAILARFFEGRAFAELGRRFALSEDGARMRVDRALEKLRALLARRGVTSTATALGVMLTAEAAHAAPAGLATTIAGAALTSATTATTSTLATAVQFMITSKTVAGAAGAIVLAAAMGTAVHQSHAQQAAARELSAATADTARLEASLREARQKAATAEQARDEATAALASAEAQAAKAAPAPSAASGAQDALAAGRAFLAEHPEARQLWDERERANLASKFAPIVHAMNLTPDEVDRLETIFIGAMSGVTTIGVPGGTIALKREPTLSSAEAQAQMLALLGPDRLAEFGRLSKIAPTFDLTVKLAAAVYRTAPLTSDQATQMMQIFADQSPVAKPGATGIDWNAVQERAGAVLAPKQLAGLAAVRSNFEYQQAINQVTKAATNAALNPKAGGTQAR